MATRLFLPPKTRELHRLANMAPANPGSLAALVVQAVEHEQNRLDTIAETLVMVGLLTHCNVLLGNEVVTVRGAHFQWVSGSRGDRTQAAHCLPGWVQFNSQPLHEMDGWNVPNLQERGLKAFAFAIKVRNLASRVDLTGEMINVSDSYIEKMSHRRGLKDNLRHAVELQTQAQRRRAKKDPWVIQEVLQDVMATYQHRASYVCEERLDDLALQLRAAREANAISRLESKRLVVETYIAVLRDRGFQPAALSNHGFEDILKDVLADYGKAPFR